MDDNSYWAIAERDIEIQNPITDRKLRLLDDYCDIRNGLHVLDIGCGEGQWNPILRKLRPGIRYLGVDPSEYAVERFGRERNLKLGGFADLGGINLTKTYDLIICSDTLYYVPRRDLDVGLSLIAQMLGGIAFLEAYASDEALEGDFKDIERRTASFYRRLFRRHGFVSCGPHCYAGRALRGRVMEMERGGI